MAAPGPKNEIMARDGQETVETRAELDTRACVINGEDCHGERTCIAGGISCEYADGSKFIQLLSYHLTSTEENVTNLSALLQRPLR